MPIPEMYRLENDSSDAAVKAAISACIAAEVRAGKEQKEAIAICFSMAREKSGRPPEQASTEPGPAPEGGQDA